MTAKIHESAEDHADGAVPRRARARAAGREGAGKAARGDGQVVKVNLTLTAKAAERLGVFSVKTGRSRGDLVTELVETHLRRYQVRDLGAGPAEAVTGEDRQAESAA